MRLAKVDGGFLTVDAYVYGYVKFSIQEININKPTNQ